MPNFNYNFFMYLSVYAYLCAKILGLGPYSFNRYTRRYDRSRILQLYTIVAGCVVFYSNYITNEKLLASIDYNYKIIPPQALIQLFKIVGSLNIAINYLNVLWLNRKIMNAKNKLVTIGFEIFVYAKNKYVNLSFKYFMIFLFKEMLLKWVIYIANVLALRILSNNQLTYVDAITNCLAQFITYLVSSHFIANLMNSIHLYDIINGELAEIMSELKRKQNNIRIVQILNLCNSLDHLCVLHSKITLCFKGLIMVFSLPMLMQISFLFANIVSFAFFELSLIILNIQNCVAPSNLQMLRICGIFNVCLGLIQLFSYAILSSRIVQKSHKAGQLLSTFAQIGIVDERFVSSVESFSLSLEQNKFEISICGLFVVNYELMYAMAASMTSYLIILVQYQLEFSKST